MEHYVNLLKKIQRDNKENEEMVVQLKDIVLKIQTENKALEAENQQLKQENSQVYLKLEEYEKHFLELKAYYQSQVSMEKPKKTSTPDKERPKLQSPPQQKKDGQ